MSQLFECQRHTNVSNYLFDPCMVSFKDPFACVLFMAQQSYNSQLSVLPQLVPLCLTILTAQFPGPDRMNLYASLSTDLLVDS